MSGFNHRLPAGKPPACAFLESVFDEAYLQSYASPMTTASSPRGGCQRVRPNKSVGAPNRKDSIAEYYEALKREFDQGSDRACAIVTAIILKERLKFLLKEHLVANHASQDPLFDGANAQLANFHNVIKMAYRIGLISEKCARDLDLIRRIRNDFAHKLSEHALEFSSLTFESPEISDRVRELDSSHGLFERSKRKRFSIKGRFDDGMRGHFLFAAALMIRNLTEGSGKRVKPIKAAELEDGYTARSIFW